LLRTYLGDQTGQRVHAGAIERGSVESLHAVLWFADIRGFTPMSDTSPGPIVIELLNDVFEVIVATLRSRGGEVLKFLGDGVLATLSFNEVDRASTCHDALDAAMETLRRLEVVNTKRAEAGLPTAKEDSAIDSVHMFRRGELIKNDVFALGSGGLLQHNTDEGAPITQVSRGPLPDVSERDQAATIEAILMGAIEGGIGLEHLESRVYAAALAKTRGNVSAAARLLKISRAQLDYRISKGGN
jgi:Bacterial regulatory protein, Fis family